MVSKSKAIGMLVSLAGLSGIALKAAATLPCATAIGCAVNAPEIDPASAASALTILGGGLLIIREWRRKKK